MQPNCTVSDVPVDTNETSSGQGKGSHQRAGHCERDIRLNSGSFSQVSG